MQDGELIARADANYFEGMRRLVAAMHGSEVREFDGMLCLNSGTGVAWFNIAFVTRPLDDPEGAIAAAANFFDSEGKQFILRVRAGLDAGFEAAAPALGFPYSDTVPGMILPAVAAPDVSAKGLTIRTTLDEDTLSPHRRLIAQAFDLPADLGDAYLPLRITTTPDLLLYTGYVDGQPVATSALIATHRVAGVYNVSCAPEFRRRGIGEAMTWHAVREGARIGCVMASLQASEMGKPVYERMGFREMIGYRTYHRPGV
jgi:GNAT superfamily N-acetyltransferase